MWVCLLGGGGGLEKSVIRVPFVSRRSEPSWKPCLMFCLSCVHIFTVVSLHVHHAFGDVRLSGTLRWRACVCWPHLSFPTRQSRSTRIQSSQPSRFVHTGSAVSAISCWCTCAGICFPYLLLLPCMCVSPPPPPLPTSCVIASWFLGIDYLLCKCCLDVILLFNCLCMSPGIAMVWYFFLPFFFFFLKIVSFILIACISLVPLYVLLLRIYVLLFNCFIAACQRRQKMICYCACDWSTACRENIQRRGYVFVLCVCMYTSVCVCYCLRYIKIQVW